MWAIYICLLLYYEAVKIYFYQQVGWGAQLSDSWLLGNILTAKFFQFHNRFVFVWRWFGASCIKVTEADQTTHMTTQSICEKSDNLSKRGSMSIGFSWKKITTTLKTTNKIIEDEWNTALVTKHFRKSTKLLSRCALCNLSFLFINYRSH